MDYSEKRNFIRIKTDSKIEYKVVGTDITHIGQCINLSAGGVLFACAQHHVPGTVMEISIKPEQIMVTPLDATIKVVRTQSTSNGSYHIAGKIRDTL